MKKLLLTGGIFFYLIMSQTLQAEVIVFNTPPVNTNIQQSIVAIFTDNAGNTYQRTVYFNPTLGGVDIGNSNAYASVYFPTLDVGYLRNNGYWVGKDGYYWNNGNRYYVGPSWNDHWHSHWDAERHGGYYDGEHGHAEWNRGSGGWNRHNNNWNEHGGGWNRHNPGGWEGRDNEEHHGHAEERKGLGGEEHRDRDDRRRGGGGSGREHRR